MIATLAKDELLRTLTEAKAEMRAVEALLAGDARCLELLARIAHATSRLDDAGDSPVKAHSAYCVVRLDEQEAACARELLDVVRHYWRLH